MRFSPHQLEAAHAVHGDGTAVDMKNGCRMLLYIS